MNNSAHTAAILNTAPEAGDLILDLTISPSGGTVIRLTPAGKPALFEATSPVGSNENFSCRINLAKFGIVQLKSFPGQGA